MDFPGLAVRYTHQLGRLSGDLLDSFAVMLRGEFSSYRRSNLLPIIRIVRCSNAHLRQGRATVSALANSTEAGWYCKALLHVVAANLIIDRDVDDKHR